MMGMNGFKNGINQKDELEGYVEELSMNNGRK